MSIKNRLKRWGKLRFFIFYPFGLFILFSATPDDRSIMAGIWFIIAGLLIRLWANGYAIKLDKLTTCGPYAYLRHPLYFGTMLLALGFMIMLKIYYIGAFFLILLSLIYYRTIKKEEAMLKDKFEQVYLDYKKSVPAMIPKIFPYKKGEKWPFSFRRLIRSQEYKLFLWMIVVVIVFHLKEELLAERETLDFKNWFLLGIAMLFILIDLGGEFIKHRARKAAA
ncbi:MAG: isoprenylcysteine carboxylmethyltransferase family protein [Candidatus Omnitrophica bacterium]|nr:isoprenylcysteine carboxylmethyltransferase family protein [Candidatus Omnitrophota bacterium]MDD5429680.1 isoprenylcysteine carboxylmethyltransferase family protein [Candidatus Omnitrophota bacterium]